MRDNNVELQKERANKYNCDGRCYTSTSMCPRVETCPETCVKEFWATIVAALIIIGIPLCTIITIIVMLVKFIIGLL